MNGRVDPRTARKSACKRRSDGNTMGAARAALAAGVALMLSTAQGFVLAPSGIPRLSGGITIAGRDTRSISTTVRTPTAVTHREAVHPRTTIAPSPCGSTTASSYMGCASSVSPCSARVSLGYTALSGSRPRQSFVGSATTMGLSSLLPGGGRKVTRQVYTAPYLEREANIDDTIYELHL